MAKKKLPVLHRLIRDMSSEAYHSTEDTWSSSQLKDLLDDEETFIKKYIRKEVPREEREAFDTGTYFHTGVLEPHKVSKEIAVFPGKVRYGKDWNEFKKKNPGKVIITGKQKDQGDGMIEAVKASPIAMKYLEGDPEVSLFVELIVYGGDIYAPAFNKVLTRDGWKNHKGKIGKGFSFVVKVRSDCIGKDFISDLKSTSGKAKDQHSVRGSISKYKYDLSASLYVDIFSLMNENIKDFYWIFASKSAPCVSATWKATKEQLLVGRAKWSFAVKKAADLAGANWEVYDYLREADPLPYELEWLKEKESDLL